MLLLSEGYSRIKRIRTARMRGGKRGRRGKLLKRKVEATLRFFV